MSDVTMTLTQALYATMIRVPVRCTGCRSGVHASYVYVFASLTVAGVPPAALAGDQLLAHMQFGTGARG